MGKKKIKIAFVDYWKHWNTENNFITNCLRERYEVEISTQPDYVFFSNFNRFFAHMKYQNCIKIFYTQENICPDFNFADYGIGFENISFSDRYFRFPLYLIPERYEESWKLMCKKHLYTKENRASLCSRKFCSFVVSNDKASPIRGKFFQTLSGYKRVDSGGKYLNNVGMPNGVPDKSEFDKEHKFSICFENSSQPGYTTEKIIEAFASGTVPIYWGDPEIAKTFNENAFINVTDFASIDEAVTFIKKVDKDDELYLKMLAAPALCQGAKNWEENQKEFREFLFNIFDQPMGKAYRRNRVFWGKYYTDRQISMRNCYCFLNNNTLMHLVYKVFEKAKNAIAK